MLERQWERTRIHAFQLPTGAGKSLIGRLVQMKTDAYTLVPNNNLLDQITGDYPHVNYLKGASHYNCEDDETTCEAKRRAKQKPCEGCPYVACRSAAFRGEATFFNPISYYYLTIHPKFPEENREKVVIIDEAHKLTGMLALLSTTKLDCLEHCLPVEEVPLSDLIEALENTRKLAKQAAKLALKANDVKTAKEYSETAQKVGFCIRGLTEYPDLYCVEWVTEKDRRKRDVRRLSIEPLILPSTFLDQVIGNADRVILMSATLTREAVKEIARKEDFTYYAQPSVVPAEDRKIMIDYQGFTSKTEPEEIAQWIQNVWEKEGRPNTIVHVTYSMAYRISKLFKGRFLTHKPETKAATLAKFKKQGGIWLAPGCAEGVDLPGDEARLNLIPVLPFANWGAKSVQGRIKIKGRIWYQRDCMTTLVQQIGRTNRGVGDKSLTVIGDDRAADMFDRFERELGSSFMNAIDWRDYDET